MDNNEILLKTLEKENKLISENYDKLMEELKKSRQETLEQKEITSKIVAERDELQKQLDSIIYSRSYKAMQKIKKILGR